ncbi:MAG: hypothetical protein ACREFX_15480, partial [Opitutaceae bacterium]
SSPAEPGFRRTPSPVRATPPASAASGAPPLAEVPTSAPVPADRSATASWIETAGFGIRTFVDCLGADSPSDGYATAFKALDTHRRRKEKEAEARHKAARAAAKDSKPAVRRARKSG